MANQELFELNFTGAIRPEMVRAKDLSDVLLAVEEMISSTAFTIDQAFSGEITVGLSKIESNSLDLGFSSSLPNIVSPAWSRVIDAVNANNFNLLPRLARKGVRRVVRFTEKYKCDAQLYLPSEGKSAVATVTPKTVVRDAPVIRGETTLYGTLVRIGGRRPKAWMSFIDGNALPCKTNEAVAKQLGGHLYNLIGVHGAVEWNAETLRVEAFTIDHLTDFKEVPARQAINELRVKYGRYFDDIGDADAFVSELRD